MSEMRAAVSQPGGGLAVASRELPEPAPGFARVRVLACGICGTDLHFHHAGLWAPGHVPGHEMFGEVDALGDGVTNVAPGDRVAVAFSLNPKNGACLLVSYSR